MKEYNRIIETLITRWLFKGKALIIIDARQVGKTTLLTSISNKLGNTLWLNADENNTSVKSSIL